MTIPGEPLPHVAAIPPYPPGRPIDAVAREFGLDPARIVKLASNENPLGCSPAVSRAIEQLAAAPNIYPDFDCYDLRHAIAADAGVQPDQVLCGEGSSEIILLAVRAYLDGSRSAIIPQYSFQSYEGATRSVDAGAIIVPALDYGADIDAILATVTDRTHILFLATPNNPTGTIIAPDALARVVDELPPHVLLLLDEAYRDYVPAALRPDVLALLASRPNMLVMRTFSKLHGLAGLRVGYALGQPDLLQLLRRLQLPFSVSSVAQAAAIAALGDHDFAEKSRLLNETERARMQAAFDQRGIEHVASAANFVLARTGNGPTLARQLMRGGVIIRPVANYGLPDWIRVSIGLPHQNDIFFARLDEMMASHAHQPA